jgi:hypothetical protein
VALSLVTEHEAHKVSYEKLVAAVVRGALCCLESKLGVGIPNLQIFIRPQEKFQTGQVNLTKFKTYY